MGERDSTTDAASEVAGPTSGRSAAEAGRPDAEGRPGGDAEDVQVLHSTRLPSAGTAALRSSLDDQQARTDELRTALDELRTALEAAPGAAPGPEEPSKNGPAPPPPRRPSRRAVVVALAGAALAAAVVVPVAVAQRSSRPAVGASASTSGSSLPTASPAGPPFSSSAGPATSAAPWGSSGPSGSASAPWGSASGPWGSASGPPGSPSGPGGGVSPTTSLPVPQPTTRPMAWPGGPVLVPPGLSASGPGADVPGLELTAVMDPDKRYVDVYERVVLRPGTASLHLALASLGPLPRALRGARTVVTDLQVELDGRAVRPVGGRTGWHVTAPGGGVLGRAVFRYRLLGAYVRQAPAPPGRATMIIRPLAAEIVLAGDDPVVVRVHDQRVGGVTCPTARRPLCGVTSGRMHTATLSSGATGIVLAQVALS